VGEEFSALSAAVAAKDEAAVVAAATEIDSVCLVASAEAPKTEKEALVALLEETRALRGEVSDLSDNVGVSTSDSSLIFG
jgi:phage I-like protein